MMVSMLTTRLSFVMTGCGGNETTCSRMSSSLRTRSRNGVSKFSPGCRVRWYRPSRSTTISVACGTMRTDRISTRPTTPTTITSTTTSTRVLIPATVQIPNASGQSVLVGAGGPAGLAVLDLELHAETAGQVPRGEHLVDRTGRQDRAPAQQHGVSEAVRYLFDMVGDQHHHRRLRVAGELRQAAQQIFPAT